MKVQGPFPTRKKMRLEGFDYSSPVCYFITIVSNERRNLFGYIKDEEMKLNPAGSMLIEEYHMLEKKYNGLECLNFVVMPNHFHCILKLDKESDTSIDKLIDAFKSKTTVRYIQGVKEQGWAPFNRHVWQRNYWDDILWNQRQFEYVRNYILLNPSRWAKDNLNPEHANDVDHVLRGLKDLRY